MLGFFPGEFENAPLGNVFARDDDDWDVTNKTFVMVGDEMSMHFRLASSYLERLDLVVKITGTYGIIGIQ
jgi:hypothetical protein